MRGDRVIATARSSKKLEEFVQCYDQDVRHNIRTIQLDITEGEVSIKEKANKAAAFWGQIDVVVNNAGESVIARKLYAASLVHDRQVLDIQAF